MDVTEAQANLDLLAYDPRLWEGLRSRTNCYDDANTWATVSPYLILHGYHRTTSGLQEQRNGYRGIPRAVMGGGQHAYVCIEAIGDVWCEYHHTAEGRSYFCNPQLKTLAATFVHHKDVLYGVQEWHRVFAILRGRLFPNAGLTDLDLYSSGGTMYRYDVAHHSNRPICWRTTSGIGILGLYSKCLTHAYLSTGHRANTKRFSSTGAHLGAAEVEVEEGIAGNIYDSVALGESTSRFSTTKGSGYLPESTGVTGPSACSNPTEHDVCPGRALVTPPPVADQVAFNPSKLIDRTTGLGVRPPVKKALVIGINYCHSTAPGVGRLRFAIKDAKRVVRSLKGCGFSEGNVVLLTDQRRGRATYAALVERICWLVDDAKAGDTLFFFYSGHGRNDHPPHGAGLPMEDNQVITRRELEDNLVGRVPKGCELHLVIDSCFASSMIKLQYRVKQMASNYDADSSAITVARPTVLPSNLPSFLPLARPVPLTAGLDQSALPKNAIAAPYYSIQTIASQARVGGSPTTNANRTIQHTIPLSAALSFSATHNEMFYGQHSPPKASQVQDPFYQRPGEEKIAKPMGRVFFWAGTGEHQNSFESYNAPDARDGVVIQNGIVANALCAALDTFAAKKLVLRHVWQSLSDNIEKENIWRHERDSKNSTAERAKLIPANRIQLAELWVSQHEPSSTTTSVLDQPMFSS